MVTMVTVGGARQQEAGRALDSSWELTADPPAQR